MPVFTTGEIIDALARNDTAQLIGAVETEQVDFKLSPYVLTENYQKWELAKDVAAFVTRGLMPRTVKAPRVVPGR